MHFDGRAILLDIEGTTSSISYVFDVMFPYVRTHVADFLAENWESLDVQQALDQIAQDTNGDRKQWIGQSQDPVAAAVTKVNELMDSDSKTTGLKDLQGQIWKSGFENGQLVGHLFDDVAPAIQNWKRQGKKVFIYSSGSAAAQKLYFGHSEAGDLLKDLDGHFDTTIGPKRDVASYEAIAAAIGIPGDQILFLSDVEAELDAALASGMNTALSVRPGNPHRSGNKHPAISSFAEIESAETA